MLQYAIKPRSVKAESQAGVVPRKRNVRAAPDACALAALCADLNIAAAVHVLISSKMQILRDASKPAASAGLVFDLLNYGSKI
ncbi:hypothetical protein RJ639_018237 [Escallonia herrerae]|uniref:Uncharacterized protein n=1 Tax=Escallonia herrerae TaxID=1293975 RepID=A0AA89AJI8_9ASTE|nr:hypothetical protein RJ639_018237 [Escallonia herrerae]